eukprot:Nk52_evm47s554 gene=Nk52_evmTU47s554
MVASARLVPTGIQGARWGCSSSSGFLSRGYATEAVTKKVNGYYIMKGKTGYFIQKPLNEDDPPPSPPKEQDVIKETKLIVKGIGFKAYLEKDMLLMELGFAHKYGIRIPSDIDCRVLKGNVISIRGYDKQHIRDFGDTIRRLRPVEPYKGKGIRFADHPEKLKKRKK